MPAPPMIRSPMADSSDKVIPGEMARMQATQWFSQRDEVAGDPLLDARFKQWRDADPEHACAYQALEDLWRNSAFEQALKNIEVDLDIPPAPRWHKRRPVRRLAAAAALLLMLGAGWMSDVPMHMRADHITALAEVQRLTLDDGSRIVLGSNSAISVHMEGDDRRISLLRGEFYIEAFHDASRPLIVDAGRSTVTVAGTQFSVGLQDQLVTVAVREGRVRVADPSGGQSLLRAGQWQQVGHGQLQTLHEQGADRQLAWLNGRFLSRMCPWPRCWAHSSATIRATLCCSTTARPSS